MEKKVLYHVEKRAMEWNADLPVDLKEAIEEIEKDYQRKGINISFSAKRFEKPERLNANAGFFRSSKIVFSPEWAAYLLFRNDDTVTNAFLSTLGHELSHKEKFIYPFFYPFDFTFVAWTNEVYADFNSGKHFLNNDRQRLINGMQFKLKKKGEDIEDNTHPSWQRRIYYAENFESFNEDLILQIAKDARCKDKKLIQKIINYYKD